MHDGTPYTISKKAVAEYLEPKITSKSKDIELHLAALKKRPEIIPESIDAEVHPDYRKDNKGHRDPKNGYNNEVLIHCLYGAIRLNWKTYVVKTNMQEFCGKEANKPHSYEVMNIEIKPETSPGTAVLSDSPQVAHESDFITGAKLLENVYKAYDKGVKVLEASKKSEQEAAVIQQRTQREEAMMRVDPSGKMADDAAEHEGEPRQKVLNTIAELSDKLNPSKKVVSVDYDTNKMPDNVKKAVERGENVTGWYDPKDGSAHLYMPNIHDAYTAERTILHEVVGHKGLRELLGDKSYAAFMRKLYIDNVGGVADYVKENAYKYGYDLYKTIDEYLAEEAEKFGNDDRSLMQRAWDKVTDLLNTGLCKLGFNTKLTERDVRRVLWESKNRIKEGDAEDTIKHKAFLWLINIFA